MSERMLKINEIAPCEGKTSLEVIFRSEIHEIHLWRVVPGEWIYPHMHPVNDDIWHIMHGGGEYYLSLNETKKVGAGDIAVAAPGEVHGIFNSGPEDIIVYSVLSPIPVEIDAVPGFIYPD